MHPERLQAVVQIRERALSDSIGWDDLPGSVRQAIERHTGQVTGTSPGGDGESTSLRLILNTPAGQIFVKGTDPDAGELRRGRLALGAALAPFVTELSPPLLFRVGADGWDVTGWPALPGRPRADLTPGSADLPLIVDLLRKLSAMAAPDVPMRSTGTDWGLEPGLLDGDMLIHTDPNPTNFVVDGDRAWLVDWGWAMRGPAWMTAARLAVFLIDAGWNAPDAEQALTSIPAWAQAPPAAVGPYAEDLARSFEEAYQQRPGNQHRQHWRDITRQWADHRAKHPTSAEPAGSKPRHKTGKNS